VYVVTVEFELTLERVEEFRDAMLQQAANSLSLEEVAVSKANGLNATRLNRAFP